MTTAILSSRKHYLGVIWRLTDSICLSCTWCRIKTFGHVRKLHGNYDKTLLKRQLRVQYLAEHEYALGAIRSYGMIGSIKKSWRITPPVSEGFSSSTSYWLFEWIFKNIHVDFNQSSPIPIYPQLFGPISTDIFEKGYEALESYVNDESQTPEIRDALNALEKFFCSKGKHELILFKFLTNDKTEAEVAAVLSQHLISQLLPSPSNYFIDNHYTETMQTDVCPCGCGVPIHYGLTHVGTPQLFYGAADIVVFPKSKDLFKCRDNSASAVFTLEKEDNGEYDDGKRKNFEIDDDHEIQECKEENQSNESTMRQLCKQAISLSLCMQRTFGNETDHVSGMPMIPTCVITRDSYEVALYNAEHDFLIKTLKPMKFFENDGSLSFSAVVDLWLLINHKLFCVTLNQEILDSLRGTCNLIPQLGKERFESVVNDSKWLLQPKLLSERYLRQYNESQFSFSRIRKKKIK